MSKNLYRRGATWWARFKVRGVDQRRSLRTGVRSVALQRADTFRQELSHTRFHGEPRHRWKDAADKWSAEILERVGPATAKRYSVSLGQLRPFLEELVLEQIGRKTIAAIAGREGVKNATRRRDLTALSSVLRAAVHWGWLEVNPVKDFDRSMLPERRKAIRIPEAAEVAKLVAACPPGLARLVRFLEATGAREEEAAGLKHGQLDEGRGEATFLKTKTGKPRTILLKTPAFPAGPLGVGGTKGGTAFQPRNIRGPYVFWHGPGERYRNVASRLAAIVGRLATAGKIERFRVHDLRHRFAVLWLRAGGDIYALSRHLGHSSVKTTEIYLGYVPGGRAAEPGAQKGAQRRRSTGKGRRRKPG